MRNRIFAFVTAALLCAALAGCGAAKAASQAPSAAPTQTPAVTATPAPTAAPTAAPTPTALPAKLQNALDGCLAYEADTAGGSLKGAYAAAQLVEALVTDGVPENLSDYANSWKSGLTDDEQELLTLNWPGITYTARSIAADPAGQAELLEISGVTTDFTLYDLSAIPAAFDLLDEILPA